MQYMLVIHDNEAQLKSATQADMGAMTKAYGEFTPSIVQRTNMKAGDDVQPTSSPTPKRAPAGKTPTTDGQPETPGAWLIGAARNKAVEDIRRRALAERSRIELQADIDGDAGAGLAPAPDDDEEAVVLDDQLRLIFTCCHPALAEEAQVALTLHTLAGLSTEEIARAFLVPAPT